MLDDFRGKLKKRANQEIVHGAVERKRKGRPRKPNNEHLHLMMDGGLKEQLRSYAREQSIDMSTLVAQMVRDLLQQQRA